MAKSQRIRDPIHDLIEFNTDDFDQFLWRIIDTPEFQRLRRIKQLGFSELVFPGATHTRFAHSVGVFQTARKLMDVIKVRILEGGIDQEQSEIALTAALVHDLGHGPFSHAFEEAIKQLEKDNAKREGGDHPKSQKHEFWTRDIILGDTGVGEVIKEYNKDLQQSVAKLLTEETPSSIYAAIVSSQFDADRLDYMRRDRFMTGVQHGGFDLSWLLANLDVGKITLETDNESFAEVDSLVLKGKALEAGESYVLGLFHLYFSVYFHKATRSAEAILTGLIRRIGELCGEGDLDATGLEAHNPIVRFIREPNLDAYLRLDDFVVWGSLSNMSDAKDEIVRELATRLLQRRLFKAIEISEHLDRAEIAAFRKRLQDAKNDGRFGPIDIFEDKPSRSPYKIRGYGTPEALSKIYVKPNDDAPLIDLRDCSAVVKALEEKSIYRVFVRDGETQEKILAILQGK